MEEHLRQHAEKAGDKAGDPFICAIGPAYGENAKYCVIAELIELSEYTLSLTTAVCYLVSVIYAMDFKYRGSKFKKITTNYIFELIQKVFLSLEPSKISNKMCFFIKHLPLFLVYFK